MIAWWSHSTKKSPSVSEHCEDTDSVQEAGAPPMDELNWQLPAETEVLAK